MGILISRFRKKTTTIEILEDIDKEINRLQKNRKENQDRQKRVATGLIIYSIILYILTAVVFFLLYFPDTWPLRVLYSLPLLAFPFLIWGIKKLLHWYFVKRIAGNDVALRDLREKKKQILEDVMETETYKRAKEILEKFDPARFKKLEKDEQSCTPSSPVSGTLGTALHQRKPVLPQTPNQRLTPLSSPKLSAPNNPTKQSPNPYMNTPLRSPRPLGSTPAPQMSVGRGGGRGGPTPRQMVPMQGMPPQMGRGYGLPGPPMPRSVLPRDRGVMDRMVDYLVGDGPENRYALICRACHSHNGMALREEFEYMSFRCCYCFVMNPARKQRPLAPRLEFFTPNAKVVTLTKPEESNDDETDEDNDTESKDDDTKGNSNEEEINSPKSLSSGTSMSTSSFVTSPSTLNFSSVSASSFVSSPNSMDDVTSKSTGSRVPTATSTKKVSFGLPTTTLYSIESSETSSQLDSSSLPPIDCDGEIDLYQLSGTNKNNSSSGPVDTLVKDEESDAGTEKLSSISHESDDGYEIVTAEGEVNGDVPESDTSKNNDTETGGK